LKGLGLIKPDSNAVFEAMDSFRITGTKSFRVTCKVDVEIEEYGVESGDDEMYSYAEVIFLLFFIKTSGLLEIFINACIM